MGVKTKSPETIKGVACKWGSGQKSPGGCFKLGGACTTGLGMGGEGVEGMRYTFALAS